MIRRLFFASIAILTLASAASAVLPDEVLDDPVLESRARELSKGLRCLVCQNQSIDDSAAGLARDLRIIVRERLVAGDTDDEVMNYMTARFGDFILLRPPFNALTVALWAGPLAMFLVGLAAAVRWLRRRLRRSLEDGVQPLSVGEHARLAELLERDDRTA